MIHSQETRQFPRQFHSRMIHSQETRPLYYHLLLTDHVFLKTRVSRVKERISFFLLR